MRHLLLLAACAATLAACSDGSGVAPPADAAIAASAGPGATTRDLKLMTRNVYLGANLDPILLATDPSKIPIFAGQIFGQVTATNFRERAGAIAREIVRAQPDIVGLQELALWRVQTGPDPFAPANTVAYDFLHLLLDSLAAQGADYDSVIVQQGSDAQLPAVVSANPLTIIGVRLTERTGIIARHGVPVWDAKGGNYQAAVQIDLGGATLAERRSWASVRASAGGHELRFVTTQLEQQRSQAIQLAQANELISTLADEPARLVISGDFNSAADGSQTPTYGMLLAAGYRDAWSDREPRDPGYTCCLGDDLRTAAPALDQRLDLILVRDSFTEASHGIPGRVRVAIVGTAPAERTASGLWPSDHAGLVAELHLPPMGEEH